MLRLAVRALNAVANPGKRLQSGGSNRSLAALADAILPPGNSSQGSIDLGNPFAFVSFEGDFESLLGYIAGHVRLMSARAALVGFTHSEILLRLGRPREIGVQSVSFRLEGCLELALHRRLKYRHGWFLFTFKIS